jgi:hypothetical protein
VELLLDEMYAEKLAQALRDQGIDAATVADLGMAGRSDDDVFAAATDGECAAHRERQRLRPALQRACRRGRAPLRRADSAVVAVLQAANTAAC